MPVAFCKKLPTFVYCEDGRYYKNLIYADHPLVANWFVCFDPDEPAEFVKRVSAAFDPLDCLRVRGFGACLRGIVDARRRKERRLFNDNPQSADFAVSFWLAFRRGVPLPAPNRYDAADEWSEARPTEPGVFFGLKED